MSVPVLTRHDHGCKWGRFDGTVDADANILSGGVRPGHSDAAKRFADAYCLHRAAGTVTGWIAVRYDDGASNGDVYGSRAEAVSQCWPWEDRYFYCSLAASPSMTVCQAEALLRFRRVMAEMDQADRDMAGGGPEVIPRLANEDIEAQIRAVRSGQGMVAMGYRR